MDLIFFSRPPWVWKKNPTLRAEVLKDLTFDTSKKKFPKKLFFRKNFFFFVLVLNKSEKNIFGIRTTIWGFLGPTHSVLGVFYDFWVFDVFEWFRYAKICQSHGFIEKQKKTSKHGRGTQKSFSMHISNIKNILVFEKKKFRFWIFFWGGSTFEKNSSWLCMASRNHTKPKHRKKCPRQTQKSWHTPNSGPNTKTIFFWLF